MLFYRLHFEPLEASLRSDTPAVLWTDPLDPVTVQMGDESEFVDVVKATDELPAQDDHERQADSEEMASSVVVTNEGQDNHVDVKNSTDMKQVSKSDSNGDKETAASMSVVHDDKLVEEATEKLPAQDDHDQMVGEVGTNKETAGAVPSEGEDKCGKAPVEESSAHCQQEELSANGANSREETAIQVTSTSEAVVNPFFEVQRNSRYPALLKNDPFHMLEFEKPNFQKQIYSTP